MADPELAEMWKVSLGMAECVTVSLLATSIGMYAYLGTRSTRYYQGLVRTFRGLYAPNWICPLIYTAWMATSGFAFWLVTFAADCNTGKYGFDLNPWTLFFYILWTVPMGVRLMFFSGVQWRALLVTTDLVALAFGLTHFIMAIINMPHQPKLVCEALLPPIDPLGSVAKVFFYVFWGVTIFIIFVVTLRDASILLKPLQSFLPIVYWNKYWYESEAECTTVCRELTPCQMRDMDKKYPGYADAVELIRDADRQERVEAVKAKMAKIPAEPGAKRDNEEAGLMAGVETGDEAEALDFGQEPSASNFNMSWLNDAVNHNQRKAGQKDD